MQGSTQRSGLDSCSRHFSAGSRAKGETYFRGRRVILNGLDQGIIDAQVRGSGDIYYDVRIDAANPRDGLLVACSCPHFADGNLCKHLWATLLAAKKEGMLDSLASIKKIEIYGEIDLLEQEIDLLEQWDDFDEPENYLRQLAENIANRLQGRNGRSTARSTRPPQKSKANAWHRALAAPSASNDLIYRGLTADVAKERRIFYLIDLAASVGAGGIMIELMRQEKRKDGQWGKLKSLKIRRDALADISSPEDRAVLGELLGNRVSSSGYYGSFGWGYDSGYDVNSILLSPACYAILPRLCATGRFGWVLGIESPDDMRLTAWDEGPAWQFRLRITPNEKRKQWTVAGELFRGNESVAAAEPVFVAVPQMVLFEKWIAPLRLPSGTRWFAALRTTGSLAVPYADRRQFLEALWQDGEPPEIVWPANLQPEVVPAAPHGYLRVHQQSTNNRITYKAIRDNLYADVEFDYDVQRIKPNDTRSGIVDESAAKVLIRDASCEANLLQNLRELGMRRNSSPSYERQPGDLQFPLKRLDETVARLVADGWQVEAKGAKIRAAGKFSLSVHASGVDWFELESQIDFGGETATLPELLAAVRAGENYVKLGDGSRGMLPQQWLARFAPLADLAEQQDGKLRFKPAQSLLLDALLSEKNAEIQVKVDEQFKKFRQKLQKFSGVKPKKAPRTFRGELRPYQENGVGWLGFLEEFNLGGCLADDMGLGKTIQVLAWLLARRKPDQNAKPTLIVVPKSLVFNWIEEAGRFAPKLTTLNYTGLDRSERATDFAQCDVVLTTYGTLRRDIAKLKDHHFDCVILDEAQAIKNDASQTAKACRLLSADLRLALTGTPVENHLGELWSLFEFLNPGMLGRSSAFRTYCQQADEKPEVRELLQRGLAPFILRRTKQQVLKDLPDKTEQTIHCELSPAERKKYNELRDYYRASLQQRIDSDGMNKSKMHVLEALLRLRQAACHPGLLDKKLAGKSSAKLDVLMEQIAEVTQEGHKALVFSQFTTLLGIVRQQLDKNGIAYEYLDGKTRNRQDKVDRFQTDAACPLFLISLKAGGCGLNLTAADYVFLLDPWWNPAVEAQAIDRTHRIGQTRNVFAYRLIAQDTVEEKILELQQQKRDLADAIISSNTNVLAKLTAEDLQVLLS